MPSSTSPIDHSTRLLLLPDRLPRSAGYEPDWQVTNAMGPNPVWLAELLSEVMELRPGMRVLDLGCGRAASSIFLASEFGVQVWASDLWIGPTENRVRVEQAGVADRVFPLRVEAHALPFAEGYFDAIVSIDAYHYFGTDGLYLSQCSRFLRPGGLLGIVVPGLVRELGEESPAQLTRMFSGSDLTTLHTPEWWRAHWARTGLVDVLSADHVPDAAGLWLRWTDGCIAYGKATGRWPRGPAGRDPLADNQACADMLRADAGTTLSLTRVVARRK